MNRDDPPSRPPNPMGQKPRVPVGPRRETPAAPRAPASTPPASSPRPSAPASTPSANTTGPRNRPARAINAPARPLSSPERGPAPRTDEDLASTDTDPGEAGGEYASTLLQPRAPGAPRRSGGARGSTPASDAPTSRGGKSSARGASTPRPPRTPARRALRVAVWVMGALFGAALLGALTVAGLFAYYSRGLPDVRNLRAHWRPPQTTRILARDGSVLAELFVERRTVVPIERIPENLVRAVLAAEDADFYRHHGLDYPGMLRALWVNVRHGTTAQGASTITQQVVKNVLLSPERTFARKFREVLLAYRIEQELSKNEILYLYLNHIGFGHGRNGVEEAALYYFGRHVNELTLGECVIIAGIPKNPTHYSPRNNLEAARTRRHWILGQMVRNQFVTQAQADAADAEPVRLAEPSDDAEGTAPEVVEAVRQVLRQTVGEEAMRAGGFTVQTTIDPALNRAAREALQSGLRELDTRQGYFGPLLAPGVRRVRGHAGYVLPGEAPPADGRLLPGHIYGGLVESTVDPDPATHAPGSIVVRVGSVSGRVPWNTVARYVRADALPSTFAPRGAIVRVSVDRVASPPPAGAPANESLLPPMRLELGPQGAIVAIDPVSREVRAMVGGYDAIAGMFDRAARAQRQAGSSFKPFLYSLALSSRRYTLASTVDPNPACFDRWCPRESHPRRAADGPEPPMRLREALAFSRNLVAARVVTDLGPQALADHATHIGITSALTPTPSLALGTSDVTPLEMTNAYATWDAGGQYAPPVLITRITGPGNREVALPTLPAPHRAVAPEEAYLMTSLMESVVDHGTGQRARVLHRPVAGKTGTSNEARDAWFIGYTPDLVAGVWVGFDDRQPLGPGEEGARSALPVWTAFMQRYVRDWHRPPIDFPRPPGLVEVAIDPATGRLPYPNEPTPMTELFLAGTEPREIATPPGDPNFFRTFFTGGDGGIGIESEPTDAAVSEAPATLPATPAAPAGAAAGIPQSTPGGEPPASVPSLTNAGPGTPAGEPLQRPPPNAPINVPAPPPASVPQAPPPNVAPVPEPIGSPGAGAPP